MDIVDFLDLLFEDYYDRSRFIICLCLGITIVILALVLTPLHEKYRFSNDEGFLNNVWLVSWDRLWESTRHWLFESWSWRPASSAAANAAIGFLHAVSIVLIVPTLCLLIWVPFTVLYFFPAGIGVIAGGLIGYAAAFLARIFSILLGVFGLCIGWSVSPSVFYINGAHIAIYGTHAFFIGLSLYVAATLFRMSIPKPSKERAVKPTTAERQRARALVPGKPQVLTFQEFELGSLEEDLLRHGADGSLIKTHFAGLVERSKYKAYTKLIRKKREMIEQFTEYIRALREAKAAYSKLQAAEEIEAIQRAKRSLEMLEVLCQREKTEQYARHERELAQLEFSVKKAQKELEWLKLHFVRISRGC